MKALVCFLLAGAVAIFSTVPFASAQIMNGMRRGFTATDLDDPVVTGHSVYRINLDNPGASVELGRTNVGQELEGFYSVDDDASGRASLFGVAENPDTTSLNLPSIVVNLTAAAVSPGGLGVPQCNTNANFGTEAGAAQDPDPNEYDAAGNTIFAIFSNDLTTPPPNVRATKLSVLNSCGEEIDILNITDDLYLDGLAVGGDGALYATDARITDSLYRFNFDDREWEVVGPLDSIGPIEDFSEDTGLANYRGLGGDETNLYMVTEGDGARLGRLWTVALSGQATLVGNGEIRLAVDGSEVPEDLEGFDIPWQPLVNEQ